MNTPQDIRSLLPFFQLYGQAPPVEDFKKRCREYCSMNKNIHHVVTSQILAIDIRRVIRLLEIFDKQIDLSNYDWTTTEYYVYRNDRRWKDHKETVDRIFGVKRLYADIVKNGQHIPIAVSEDGYLIDGMHRLAISIHSGTDTTSINFLKYMNCFSNQEVKVVKNFMARIRKQFNCGMN